MPTLTGAADRHVVIDKREGQYLCFPDVCVTGSGRLICAYNEFDQHAATRRGLLVKTSDDGGHSWSEAARLSTDHGHCPRLTVLASGEVLLLDHNGTRAYSSHEQGETWSGPHDTGRNNCHAVADRPLPLPDGSLLTTAHGHQGEPLPSLGQPPTQQKIFRSADGGKNYEPYSILYEGPFLPLCEASLCTLPDGRLAALLRENSRVYEPMSLCFSEDQGLTWTPPAPTTLVGHRPTLGMTSSGDLLVTYRDVGPDSGTAAWIGSLEELQAPYLVHGLAPAATQCTPSGMRVPMSAATPARWALRPMTDATTARAVVECEVQALDDEGCGVHMGVWWAIFPDHIQAQLPEQYKNGKHKVLRRSIPEGQPNTLRFTYEGGIVTLHVNGRKRAAVNVDPAARTTRAMVFGSPGKGSGGQLWLRLSQRINEPTFGRDHRWDWTPDQGLPHTPKLRAVLELDNDREAHYGDFGYSGWCELEDGRFFCVYHHGGSDEDGYRPDFSSHVRGAWFSRDDFR